MTHGDALIASLLRAAAPLLLDPPLGSEMAVLFPEDLDPFERHYRYGVVVDAELRLVGTGCHVFGGTSYLAGDDGGADETVFTVLEIDAVDVYQARAVRRLHLPELGCPPGTMIHRDETGEDRYDGEAWRTNQPRSFEAAD